MVDEDSLLSYLQNALPPISTNPPPVPVPKTTNTAYNADDINSIDVWHDFNLSTILRTHGSFLQQASLPLDPMPESPPDAIATDIVS